MALFPFSFMQSQSPYDPDAAAFFARVAAAGGTLSNTEKTATNQLVLDMKSYGIWTSMKAIYPMVGASAAACAQNLVSASFTGSFTSGWTFASTGVTPNGTSAYMDTNFSPFVSSTANSFHLSIYSRTNTNVNAYDFAVNNNSANAYNPEYSIRMQRADLKMSTVMGDYNNQFIAETVANSLGFGIGTRTASNAMKLYKNGTALNSQTATSSTTYPNYNVYLGATNFGGSGSGYSSRQYAFASIGDGLTDTQASNFYTAVQTFNQTLNRQVGAQIVSDADAQAYINRVYTAGGSLTNTEANAVNQLVIDMKAAGIWTAMKAVYPMVGASAAACAQNLKSSSFTGSFSSGWTFSANGVQGNGTSAYMDTNLISNSVLSISSAAMGFSTNIASTMGIEFGSQWTIEGMSVWSNFSSISNSRIGRGADASTTPYYTAGRIHGSRQTSSLQTLYRNSSAVATGSGTITVLDSVNTLTLGGLNLAGGVGLWSDARFDFAYVSDGLSSTNISNLDAAIVTFNTTLSR